METSQFTDSLKLEGIPPVDVSQTDGEIRVAHLVSGTGEEMLDDIDYVGMLFIEAQRHHDDIGRLRGFAIDKREKEALQYHCEEEWIQDAIEIPADEEHIDQIEEVTAPVIEKIRETLSAPRDISDQFN